MKTLKALIAIATLIMIILVGSNELVAQSTQKAQGEAATAPVNARKTIGFRCITWQHKHIHDMAAAKQLIESLEKIGCEVTQEDHNGHLDVKYRCATWKSITVENDEFATQWTNWLVGNGMETVRVDPPAIAGLELVKFRHTEWKNLHIHDSNQATQMVAMLKLIGCEAEQHQHDGHFDVRFRAAEWKTIALHNHQAAHSWQEWLNSNGFETEHSH